MKYKLGTLKQGETLKFEEYTKIKRYRIPKIESQKNEKTKHTN